jgi:hypothetical protein
MSRIEKIIEIHAPADVALQTWRRLEWLALAEGLSFHPEPGDEMKDWRLLRGRPVIAAPTVSGCRSLTWEFNRAAITFQGRVDFIPAEGGCVARVQVDYRPPLGWLGEFVAAVVWDVEMRLEADLERLKAAIERTEFIPLTRDRVRPYVERDEARPARSFIASD